METFRWPNDTERTLMIGRTGSGKTTAALYQLSMKNWERKPWVVFDTKGDKDIGVIGRMEGVKHIKITEQPSDNGLFIVRPLPNQDDEINDFLWRIHTRNNVGLYFDEGYMVGKPDALNALLTQGRSKHIPIIMNTQRPTWLSRFCFTESDYFQVFALTDRDDRKSVQRFIPEERADLEERLPPYHSIWYDVKSDRVFKFKPTPPSEQIIEGFRTRLMPRRIAI